MRRHTILRQLDTWSRRCLHSASGGICSGDNIQLRGLVFHGYHGVLPEENTLGQKFVVDATIFSDLSQAGRTDDLHDTLDYAAVYETIRNIVEGKPYNLIEAVAETIAATILEEDKVKSVTVRIQKPQVAVPGVVESLGVEIRRSK